MISKFISYLSIGFIHRTYHLWEKSNSLNEPSIRSGENFLSITSLKIFAC